MAERAKRETAKHHVKKTAPWLAMVATLFATWMESRSNATDTANTAAARAGKQATVDANTTSDARADHAWKVMKFVLEKQEQTIADCHERVDEVDEELAGIIAALDERSPRGRRARVSELRESPRARRNHSPEPPSPAASRLPDSYSAVQSVDPADPLNLE